MPNQEYSAAEIQKFTHTLGELKDYLIQRESDNGKKAERLSHLKKWLEALSQQNQTSFEHLQNNTPGSKQSIPQTSL